MARRFEFWCRNCGEHYYLESVRMSACPDKDCKDSFLELAAVVDISDNWELGGEPQNISSRQVLDRRKLS